MKKTLLIALLPILLLISCRQDAPVIPDLGKPDPDMQLVDSVIVNNTDVTTYHYDNKNRLIATHERSTLGTWSNSDHAYSYDSNGNLIKSVFTLGNGVEETYTYSYKDGVPVSGINHIAPTEHNPAEEQPIEIISSGASITRFITLGRLGNSYFNFNVVNGNTVNEIYDYHSGGLPYVSLIRNYEYGVKKNPLLYTGYKWKLPGVPFADKNDLLKATGEDKAANGGPPTVSETTFKTTYNDKGFPVFVEKTEVTNGYTYPSTVIYKYKGGK